MTPSGFPGRGSPVVPDADAAGIRCSLVAVCIGPCGPSSGCGSAPTSLRFESDRSLLAGFREEKENRSSIVANSLFERLVLIKKKIGDELYTELERANAMDLQLHQLALESIAGQLSTR